MYIPFRPTNSCLFLATEETTPVVIVLLKAKGDPIATTNSPGLKVDDCPNFITGKFLQSILMVAKSDLWSTSST
jgi:hypothetical protein